MSTNRILVVGTTPDYIDLLSRRFPGQLAFVSDIRLQRGSGGGAVPKYEFVDDLTRVDRVVIKLEYCIRKWGMVPSGVVCFDCESLLLAAKIASGFNLPFVSAEAVIVSRNKYESKRTWTEAGVNCPRSALVATRGQALGFLKKIGGPVVLKPLTGSGSELVLACHTPDQCRANFDILKGRLQEHPNIRMYGDYDLEDNPNPLRSSFVAEEMIGGREFSCDFIIDEAGLKIIRLAEKVKAVGGQMGDTLAYILPGQLPDRVDEKTLVSLLQRAAGVLGWQRSIGMVDFMIDGDNIFLLEMTPRPGGDCLPWLIEAAGGFDIFKATIDFSRGNAVQVPDHWRQLAGMRLIADQPGIIESIDTSKMSSLGKVRQVYLKIGPGHEVILPPDDFDSRVLGHVIFKPDRMEEVELECREILSFMRVNYRSALWKTSMIF